MYIPHSSEDHKHTKIKLLWLLSNPEKIFLDFGCRALQEMLEPMISSALFNPFNEM